MNIIEEYLEKYNLKYEDLTADEKTTLNTFLNAIQTGTLTIEGIKDYISAMRESVENVLVEEPEYNYIFIFKVPNRKHIFLKARLKNYILIENLLSRPEKARKALEKSLNAVKPTGKTL